MRNLFLISLCFGLSIFIKPGYTQTIHSVSPLNATINQTVIFTVTGANLPNGMAFFVENLDFPVELSGGNSNVRYFQGTFQEWGGLKAGVIKDQPGGTILHEFLVNVNEFPIINSVVPQESILGESVTFTISGLGLTNDMAYHLPDFGDGIVDYNNSTTEKTFTVTSSYNSGIKHGVIKNQSGGTTIFNFDVDVYFPIPDNLEAVAIGSDKINVSWNSVNDADHFKLYRSTSANGNYSLVYSGSTNSYQNSGLSPNTTYYYRIQACQNYNQNSCSGQSTYYANATTGGGSENHAPNSPSFRPLPNGFQYQQNVASTIPIRSSSDQDGDQTKVKIWSPNSSIPLSNPYETPLNSNETSYNIPISFNQSGNQTVYIQAFDEHGASSQVVSRIYNVLEENTDENPLEPSFINFPSEVDLNENINLIIQSGVDPNNDQVQVKVWAVSSNHPSNNPYVSSFYASGYQYNVPFVFYEEGNFLVYSQTIDINGNASNISSRSINVVNGSSNISEVEIGGLVFTAANIVETSNNIFSLEGNIIANGILQFTGSTTVDLNDLSVVGNGRVYLTDIPHVSTDVDLYNGQYEFNVPNNSEELVPILLDELNQQFKLANMPVFIEEIDFIHEGIVISGELEFPEMFGLIRGSISQLKITKSQGIKLIGEMSLNEIQATGFTLKNMNFAFNTIDNEFSGNGEIETNLFDAGANIRIVSSGIDEIGMFLSLSNPKPLGTTGLALKGLSGNINNIQSHPNPPMIVTVGTTLVPVGPPTDIVEFDDVSLSYQFGTSLTGSGSFKVLNSEAANASFEVREGLFKINADINFYDIINAAIEAGIAVNQDESIDVFARFYAALQLPDGDGFPYNWLRPFFDLPVTFASFDNILFNNELSGKGIIDLPIFDAKFSYLLNYSDGMLHKDFARNYSLFNEIVFTNKSRGTLKFLSPSKKHTDWNSLDYNRFEGRSLIINSKDYQNRKNSDGQLTQDFILSEVSETLVIRVVPEDMSFVPNLELIDPDGTEINSGNVDDFDSIMFSQNDLNNAVYFTIKSAITGVWYVMVDDVSKDQYVDVIGTNQDAGIIIDGISKLGNSVTVTWIDENPDFDGQISLYYDFDDNGIDGNLIVSGISENDETDSYTFDVSDVDPGNYYVYAIMFDENGTPVTSYSPESFSIQGEIPAPQNLSYTLTPENNIQLSWELVDDNNSYNYILYYTSDSQVNYGSMNLNTGNDQVEYVFSNTENDDHFQFMIVAQDENGVLGQASNKIEVDLAIYQMINLNAGWNLIGFNVEPNDLEVEKAFEPISDYLLMVKDEQKSYDPSLPGFLNTLSTIENGKGYWVKVTQPIPFTQRGSHIDLSNLEIELNQGWNLISFPIQHNKSVEDAIAPISNKVVLIKNIYNSYDPNLPSFLNTLDNIKPGEGYWINVSENCVLTF